jgi:Ni/Co efflux regulator RcnB
MKRFITAAATVALLAGSMGSALAQPRHDYGRHDDHRGPERHYVHHDWRKGGRIAHNDWNRGHRVDWRARHLHQPPRGYEWREVDGSYVMAAVATGVIASIILSH